jgi:hypothetical protein
MKTIKLLFVLITYVICLTTLGQIDPNDGTTPTPQPGPPNDTRPFPTDLFLRLGDSIGDEFDDAGQKISASIFESLTHRELFNTTVLGDLDLNLKVQRKVFDNQDIIDSYTVIDIMRMPLYLPVPIIGEEINPFNVGSGTFGFNLGISFGANAYSIRQVSPKDWRKLKDPKEIERRLERVEDEANDLSEDIINSNSSITFEKNLKNEEPNENDGLSRFVFWRSQNPRTRARYNKLWRILTHPLSLPLSAKRMDEYPIGDVASYALEGSVQLGVSAGWTDFQIFGQGFTRTQAGIGITTYVKGDFRLSLWKENDHFAQVKLSRIFNRGVTTNVGSLSIDQELFEGVLVLDKKLFNITEEFIPFSFSVNRNWAAQFDIGYRYDLRVPQAREAYNEAVLGRLKKSSLLAEVKGSGVTESFTRESRGNSRSQRYKMKLSVFFEKANSNSRSKTWAKIVMDGVEHMLYTASNITFKAYDSLWGKSELKRHHFLTTYNERRYRRDRKEGLGMRIEGRLEDSHTSGKELYHYLREIEIALGKPGLFPRPPKYIPQIPCDELGEHLPGISDEDCKRQKDNNKRLLARYGKTSFFYQVDLNLDHLKNIQRSSKKEFWQAMEIAFDVKKDSWSRPWKRTLSLMANSYATVLNVPLALFDVNLKPGGRLIIAWRFYRGWKKLRKLKDPQEIVSAFGDLYKTMHYSPELVMATRLLAGSAEAKYFFTAKADEVFGQRSEGGSSLGNIFPIGDEASRRIDFDRVGPRINADREAQVTGLTFDKKDEDTATISFTLKNRPAYLYFRVDQAPNWGSYKNLTRIIIQNNGEFKEGLNTLTISRNRMSGYLEKLRKAFFNGKYSKFLMAYSLEEQRFGPVNSVRFRLRDYRDIDIDFLTESEKKVGTLE